MKQRFGYILAVCCFTLTLAGCGSSPSAADSSRKEITAAAETAAAADSSAETAAVPEGTASSGSSEETAAETAETEETGSGALETIPETVLYDADGITITALKLSDDSIWGKGIDLLLENDTEKNITVQCNYLVVDNYMISNLALSSDVAAGKKSNDTLYLSSADLEAAGIHTITDIDVSLNIIDPDTFETIKTTDEVKIKTSAEGTAEEPDMSDGTELFNKDGVKIVGRYVDEDSFWGAGVELYIENNSGKNVMVQCDNMSVNDFMVTPYFSCDVLNGRKAISTITIMSSDLEDNNITSVDKVEVNFNIIDPDTYETIESSGPVSFSTK
jgi:hypothetical protein